MELGIAVLFVALVGAGLWWWRHSREPVHLASPSGVNRPTNPAGAGSRASVAPGRRCGSCRAVILEDDTVFCPRCGVRVGS